MTKQELIDRAVGLRRSGHPLEAALMWERLLVAYPDTHDDPAVWRALGLAYEQAADENPLCGSFLCNRQALMALHRYIALEPEEAKRKAARRRIGIVRYEMILAEGGLTIAVGLLMGLLALLDRTLLREKIKADRAS